MSRLPTPLRPWWPVAKKAYTRATRTFAPVSQRLARLSGHGGPWGIALTADDAVTTSGPDARLWQVREPIDIIRPLPAGDPAGDYRYRTAMAAHVPRVAVAVLPGARVDGRFGGVIANDQRLVYEFSQYFGIAGPRDHPQFLRPFRRAPVQHPGTVAVLGDRGDDNYYHFLIDVLPKLALLADCPDLPAIDAYYVPTNRGFQRALLERAGLPMDRVIDSRETPYLQARQLVVAGLPDAHLQTPEWVVSWLRDTMLPGVARDQRRRLYLTRGQAKGSRIVNNEADVVAALQPRGFEVFDAGAHTVDEQIEAFANAETIVAPHGASLANLVFATDATLIEMFPPDYVNTCYWALAGQVPGIDYRYLIGEGDIPSGDPQGVASDMTINVAQLLARLDDILRKAAGSG